MNKQKWISVVLAVVVVGGAVLLVNLTPQKKPSTGGQTPTTSTTATSTVATAYTLAQVATHSDSNSCWTAINGVVYDLTAWISAHPGGEGAILSICGKDGSTAFNGQHGGQGRPEQVLVTFKIGTLK